MKFEGMNKFMFLHKIIIIVIASNLLLFWIIKVVTIKRIYYEAPTDFPAVDICNLDAYDGNTGDFINLFFILLHFLYATHG
jgi:hypothetical protein